MRIASAPLLASLAFFAACGGPKKACEHAHEVMAAQWTGLGKEALLSVAPDERGELQKKMDAEHALASKRFVELCVALPEPAAKCIARVDLLLTAEHEMRVARSKCAKDEIGLPDAKCEAAAEAKLEQVSAGCEEHLGKFNDALFAE